MLRTLVFGGFFHVAELQRLVDSRQTLLAGSLLEPASDFQPVFHVLEDLVQAHQRETEDKRQDQAEPADQRPRPAGQILEILHSRLRL